MLQTEDGEAIADMISGYIDLLVKALKKEEIRLREKEESRVKEKEEIRLREKEETGTFFPSRKKNQGSALSIPLYFPPPPPSKI